MEEVDISAIAELFTTINNNIRCVILDACYSERQAEVIVKYIDSVIGITSAISEDVSIDFIVYFYQSLGYGKSVLEAFQV